jgi:hypothetical protein
VCFGAENIDQFRKEIKERKKGPKPKKNIGIIKKKDSRRKIMNERQLQEKWELGK